MFEKKQPDLDPSRTGCNSCALSALHLPRPLSQKELQLMEEHRVCSQITLEKGAALFKQGAPVNNLYVVRGGAVKTYVNEVDGRENIIGFFMTGDLIAPETMICDRYSMSAAALSKTYICTIPLEELKQMAAHLPVLDNYLFLAVSDELLRSHDMTQLLRTFSADERVACFLLLMSHIFEQHHLSSTQLSLPMSRREIGNYLGLAVETVSRALTRLQDQGLISVYDRIIELKDVERLKLLSNCCHAYQRNYGTRFTERLDPTF